MCSRFIEAAGTFQHRAPNHERNGWLAAWFWRLGILQTDNIICTPPWGVMEPGLRKIFVQIAEVPHCQSKWTRIFVMSMYPQTGSNTFSAGETIFTHSFVQSVLRGNFWCRAYQSYRLKLLGSYCRKGWKNGSAHKSLLIECYVYVILAAARHGISHSW